MAAMFYEYKGSSGSYIYIDKCTNYKYIPRLDYTVKILYVESGNRVLGVSWRCDGNLSIIHRVIVACRSINLRMVNVAVWSMFEAPLPKSFKIHEILRLAQ